MLAGRTLTTYSRTDRSWLASNTEGAFSKVVLVDEL